MSARLPNQNQLPNQTYKEDMISLSIKLDIFALNNYSNNNLPEQSKGHLDSTVLHMR